MSDIYVSITRDEGFYDIRCRDLCFENNKPVTSYYQRRHIISKNDDPLTDKEKMLVKLCDRIVLQDNIIGTLEKVISNKYEEVERQEKRNEEAELPCMEIVSM